MGAERIADDGTGYCLANDRGPRRGHSDDGVWAGYTVYAVNPNTDSVNGEPCYPSLDNISGVIDCVVTVTPPEITEEIIRVAGRLHIPYIWMQPGSETNAAYNLAQANSMQIVSGGPCILTAVAQRRKRHVASV